MNDSGRIIDAIADAASDPTSDNQYDLTLSAPNTQSSPGKRFFIPEAQVTVCRTSSVQGERLIRTQGATSGVLGTNVVSWSANVVTAGLRQNGLIELQMTLQSSDDEQISVVHEVHFPNVP